jgi:signal transduction histidine kinase
MQNVACRKTRGAFGPIRSLVTEVADASSPGISFLDGLAEDERNLLTTQFPVRYYPQGSVVFAEHDLGQTVYIVQQGRVAVLKEKEDATFLLLAYRGVGESVGEMAIVARRPRSASVVAVESSHLIEIRGDAFRAMMDTYPALSMAVLNLLSNRLSAADEARALAAQESIVQARKADALSSEAAHLHTLTELRQDTIDMIVHDLRNPLSIINASLALLESTLVEKELNSELEILNLAQRSTNRLISMTSSLLEAARQDRTKLVVSPHAGDLKLLLEAAVEELKPTAKEHHLVLSIALPTALPRMDFDADKLQRVVINLLDNAISYTPDGGSITLAAEVTDHEVRVHITDTGNGVPEAYRKLIFERFGRAPGAQGRKPGFGLGLYFCRQVLEAHGGRIWVEPRPGNTGSRFSFTLPRS